MSLRQGIVAIVLVLYTIFAIASPRAPIVSAEPHAQATEEPTKRPYTFPTPVFIPTYADDTPVPRTTPIAVQPGADTYTVQSGDSPWTISQKVYGDGSKYKLILQANGLDDQAKLRVGTVLKIPSLGGTPPHIAPTTTPAITQAPTTKPVTVTSVPVAPVVTTAPTLPTAITTPTENAATDFVDALPAIINILGIIMLIGAGVVGGLAYLMYQRTQRVGRISSGRQSIRIKQ